MLAERRRRWANINPAFFQRILFAGMLTLKYMWFFLITTQDERKFGGIISHRTMFLILALPLKVIENNMSREIEIV